MKDKYVKVCPRCASTNVKSDDLKIDAGPLGDMCDDCGFGKLMIGQFLEVKESELENFRKELKKKQKTLASKK